ncbi:MAG TPA: BolA family transcriptional regulator [Rickettsiales bacterium]|nr:BolA family transcriptional regulator [Rickettsiales bacterium]
MGMSAQAIETMIKEAFPDAQMKLVDLAGDNDHYELSIVSEQFRGKSRVAQHQLVYNALKGNMGGTLHALALKTSAPA